MADTAYQDEKKEASSKFSWYTASIAAKIQSNLWNILILEKDILYKYIYNMSDMHFEMIWKI